MLCAFQGRQTKKAQKWQKDAMMFSCQEYLWDCADLILTQISCWPASPPMSGAGAGGGAMLQLSE